MDKYFIFHILYKYFAKLDSAKIINLFIFLFATVIVNKKKSRLKNFCLLEKNLFIVSTQNQVGKYYFVQPSSRNTFLSRPLVLELAVCMNPLITFLSPCCISSLLSSSIYWPSLHGLCIRLAQPLQFMNKHGNVRQLVAPGGTIENGSLWMNMFLCFC